MAMEDSAAESVTKGLNCGWVWRFTPCDDSAKMLAASFD
jgi:hypothetical protein